MFLCVGLDEFILVLFAFVEFSFFSTKGQRSVKVKVRFLYSAAYVMTALQSRKWLLIGKSQWRK